MMLVLSRKLDESLAITVPPSTTPTRVYVTVTDIRSDKVKLGTVAPDAVAVNRSEVQDEIDRDLRQGPNYRGVEADPT